MSGWGLKPQREQNESGARIADTERRAEMTDVSNQNTKRRERLILARIIHERGDFCGGGGVKAAIHVGKSLFEQVASRISLTPQPP
jgi:hypothetical protein